MGWQDAPVVEEKQPNWASAPVVDAPAAPIAPPDKYAGMSFGEKAVNDLKTAAQETKRLGALGVRAINKAVVRTATMGGDLAITAANKLTGSDYDTPGKLFEDWQDTQIAPPQDRGQALAEQAMQFAAGAKLPLSGPETSAGAVSPSQQTAISARQGGYKLPPSEIPSAGAGMRAVEKFAGKKPTMEAAASSNVPQISENIAAEFGLPKGTEITDATLRSVRKGADQSGYEPIRQLGKGYADLINTIRSAREKVSALYQDYGRNRRYETLKEAQAAQAQAQNAEKVLDGAVKQLGQPELYENYVRARQTIAKTGDVEAALIESTGELKPGTLARGFDKGGKSGATEAAGRVAQAVPKAFKEAQARGLFGLTDKAMGAGLSLGGIGSYLTHDPRYAEAAGALLAGRLAGHAARLGARKALLSEPVQDYMAYTTNEQRQAALARALTAAVASQ